MQDLVRHLETMKLLAAQLTAIKAAVDKSNEMPRAEARRLGEGCNSTML